MSKSSPRRSPSADSDRAGVSDDTNTLRNSLKCDIYISRCMDFLILDAFSKIVLVQIHCSLSAIHLPFTRQNAESQGRFSPFREDSQEAGKALPAARFTQKRGAR